MDFTDLLPRILPFVSGCPDVMATNALRDATIEFCKETKAWNDYQPITLVDSEPTYGLEVPVDARVVEVMQAWVPCGRIWPKSMLDIQALLPNWQGALGSQPAYFNSPTNSTVRFFPTPMNSNSLVVTVRCAYAPTMDGESIDDDFGDEYYEALIDGAILRLASMPNKSWSNPSLASYHGGRFEQAKTDIRIKVLHDGVPSVLTAQAPPFGF
jgi:hypothetical protein